MVKKIYVGCCITGAPEEYLLEIKNLKDLIRNKFNCEVIEFIPKGVGTVEDVYLNDIHNAVFNCDFMVGEVSYPSLGLGWEIATAVEKFNKPVLLCAKKNVNISRLVEGAAGSKNPHCHFVRYSNVEELLSEIGKILAELK